MFKKLMTFGIGITALTWATTASAQVGYVPVQYVPVQSAPVQTQVIAPVAPVYQPQPAYFVPQPVPVYPRPVCAPRPICAPRPVYVAPCQSCAVPRPVYRPRHNHFSLGIFTPNFSFGFR
jgi:hypothetical protein